MGLLAVYLKVSTHKLESLQELSNEELFEAIEEMQEEEESESIDIDKMWDGLHFLLTNVSASEPIRDNKLSEFIVGKNTFSYDEDAHFITYSRSEELKEIILEIDKINFEELENNFDLAVFTQNKIYPNIWVEDDRSELFEELNNAFTSLKTFYKYSLDANIIVSIY